MDRLRRRLHLGDKEKRGTEKDLRRATRPPRDDPSSPQKSRETLGTEQGFKAEDKFDEFGLHQLWPPLSGNGSDLETRLDIIAIHGLGGHARRTFSEGDRFWLQDFLPHDIPEARIFTFAYNSAVVFGRSASGVEDYAQLLLERVHALRRKQKDQNRKIIFVCHSLGGIVFKKALILAHERSARYGLISQDVFGVMFMGTPHRGAEIAYWSKTLGALANIPLLGAVRTDLLRDLAPKSTILGNVCSQFVERGAKLQIVTVFERQPIKGLSGLIVDEDSAVMRLPNEVVLPTEADHQAMCRFYTRSNERYQSVMDLLKELAEKSLEAEQRISSEVEENFLRSLALIQHDTILYNLPRPFPNDTLDWLLMHKHYISFARSRKIKMLWIWGVAGSGKTTASRRIIEDLSSQAKAEPSKQQTIAFFFCSKQSSDIQSSSTRSSSAAVVQSILNQLLLQNPQALQHVPEDDVLYSLSSDPETSHWKILEIVISKSRNTQFFIVIDALDELDTTSRRHLVGSFAGLLAKQYKGCLSILFTDRAIPHKDYFGGQFETIELGGEKSQESTSKFLKAKVSELCNDQGIQPTIRSDIEQTLIRQADGIFLHASLLWSNFRRDMYQWSPRLIRERLVQISRLTPDTETYYCALLGRIPLALRPSARRAFMWTLYAQRPMINKEMRYAVAVAPNQQCWDDLLDNTEIGRLNIEKDYGYVLKVEESGIVSIVHQTVRELLTSSTDSASPENEAILKDFRVVPVDGHRELTEACLKVLSFKDFSIRSRSTTLGQLSNYTTIKPYPGSYFDVEIVKFPKDESERLEERLKRYPLLQYCLSAWAYHFDNNPIHQRDATPVVKYLDLEQSQFLHLYNVARQRGIIPLNWLVGHPTLHPLIQALHTGDFPDVVELITSRGAGPNVLESPGRGALFCATANKRPSSLRALLQIPGVDPNPIDGWPGPLHISAVLKQKGMLQELMASSRTDIFVTDGIGYRYSSEHWLTIHDSYWYSIEAQSSTLLHLLFAIGMEFSHEIFIELLERPGLDINATNDLGMTALALCFLSDCNPTIAATLLSRKDLRISWRTPSLPQNYPGLQMSKRALQPEAHLLTICYQRGSEWWEVEKALLDKDPYQAVEVDGDGMNLLHRYAFDGLAERLNVLLDILPKDVFRAEQPGIAFNLMGMCAQQNWLSLVQRLDKEFNFREQASSQNNRTQLHWAIENGWECKEEDLQSKDKEYLNVQDRDGNTALHLAAEHYHVEACTNLLKIGVNDQLRNKRGMTPILVAASQGHRKIVRLLLRQSKDLSVDDEGRQLLHFLSMWETELIVNNHIWDVRPDIEVRDKKGRRPLHMAAMHGNIGAVKALVDHDVQINATDHSKHTPLHYAIMQGATDVARYLKENNADLTAISGFNRTCLQLAFRSRSVSMVNLMLDYIDSNEYCNSLGRPLTPREMETVIANRDMHGQTVLHSACAMLPSQTLEVELEITENKPDEHGNPQSNHIYELIMLGANINSLDKYRSTPLHVAVKSGNIPAVKSLLLDHCDTTFRDIYGCVALDWAIVQENRYITDMLLDAGARTSPQYMARLAAQGQISKTPGFDLIATQFNQVALTPEYLEQKRLEALTIDEKIARIEALITDEQIEKFRQEYTYPSGTSFPPPPPPPSYPRS